MVTLGLLTMNYYDAGSDAGPISSDWLVSSSAAPYLSNDLLCILSLSSGFSWFSFSIFNDMRSSYIDSCLLFGDNKSSLVYSFLIDILWKKSYSFLCLSAIVLLHIF